MFRKIIKGLKDVWCGTLEFDTEPKKGSFNPVTSGGVYEAINGSGGAKEIVYFDVDPSDPPSGIYAAITEALSNNKEPVIKNDGSVYFYSSTSTGKYVFVGGYGADVVGYTTLTVSGDDSIVEETVDVLEGKYFPLYYHQNDDGFTVADRTGHAMTKTEIADAYRAGQIFMFSSYPASNTQAHWGYCCDINIDSDNTGYAEFFILSAFGGDSYEWEKYRINLSSNTEFVTLWGPNTSYSTGYSGSFAKASDVAALQSQVASLSDVSAYSVKGEATVAQLNAGPSGIQAGWAYQLTDSGTLTDGSLAVVAGDTVAWDGTKWFSLVKSDYYATKTYAQNVAKSIAPEYVGSTGAKAGLWYEHDGKLYICKENTSGDYDASKFDEFDLEQLVKRRGNNGSYVLDGVKAKEAHFFNIDPRGDYEVELSLTSWTGYSDRGNFQFFYSDGTNVTEIAAQYNDSDVHINKTYRLHTLPSMNIKYIGVYVAAPSPIEMHVQCRKLASCAPVYQSKYDGNNNTKVNAYAYNLQAGRTYRLDIDSSEATFNNISSIYDKFGIFHVANGSAVDDVSSKSIPSTYFIKAVANECYNIGFRCDSGTAITCALTDVTDDYVDVADVQRLVWSDYFVNSEDGTITASTANKMAAFSVDGIAFLDVVLNVSTGAQPNTGLAFYDDKFIYISGKTVDGGAQAKSYKTYSVDVPSNAKYCRVCIYNEFVGNFAVSGIAREPSDFANKFKYAPRLFFGSLQTYISEATADALTLINDIPTSELYEKYDELVANYPQWFSRQDDLATVTRVEDSEEFVIRSYRMSYNHMAALDHEPTNVETITSDNNKWMLGNSPRKLLIVGGMHGEEKTPCWGLMLALTELMTSNHPNAQFIRNNFVLEIVPCLNPAGWDMCRRGNCNDKVLNRAEAENEPETLAYMAWIEANKDAFMLMDFHGTQGRYAYTPVNIREPMANAVMQATERFAAALFDDNAEFYAAFDPYYASQYKPYIIAKYGTSWERSSLACRMFQDYGMLEFALETPDNIDTGAIERNDKRLCKVTKQLFFNLLPTIGSLQGDFAFK